MGDAAYTRGPTVTPTAPRTNRAAFAARLRAGLRAKYGPDDKGARAKLAAETGISLMTLSRWLNEQADPTHESLKRLAPAFDVPVAELLAVAEIIPDGGDIPAKADPTSAMVRVLHDEARGIDDPEQLAEIEKNLRHQIRITEDYMRLSIELLRRKAAAERPDSTDDATA